MKKTRNELEDSLKISIQPFIGRIGVFMFAHSIVGYVLVGPCTTVLEQNK